ncbi:MAG: ATP-binding protein [candidate division KSB1 bacterium]|nr:ATP-binding protein [candidate division KSB1 bacterium]
MNIKSIVMRPLRIKIKHRFITKLLISHILVASVPLLITGLVLIHTVQNAVEMTVRERNTELARNFARITRTRIENARKNLEFNAFNVLNNLKTRFAQDLLINEMVANFPLFSTIKILDDTGKIVISTVPNEDSLRYCHENFIHQVKQGHGYQSEVYLTEYQLPVMDMAEVIRFYDEKDLILLAQVNLKDMWEVVDSSAVGKSGQAFVFEKNGRFIAHSDPRNVYLKESFREVDILTDINNNKSGQRIYVNRDGVKMIAAYEALPELGWGVVIQQPLHEAFAVADKMKLQILLFMGTSVGLSMVIAYIFTRRIVTPVKQLVSGIDKFSAGDLKYRIPTLGADEISMLADRFNEMAEKLTLFQERLKRSERLETLSRLASVLSHEIRNPLNAMVVNMQVMERELNRPAPKLSKLRHYLCIVASEIQRVDDLVNNFLMISKTRKLDRKMVRVDQLLDETIISLQAEALQNGIRINRQYRSDDTLLFIDEQKMRQVFLNILVNAIQAMTGGGVITVELQTFVSKEPDEQLEWLVINFHDTGKGIPQELLGQIFDFYFSTKPTGTGLGLSIAQQIVEEHGGRIEVQSKVNFGSTFSVFLPKIKKKA